MAIEPDVADKPDAVEAGVIEGRVAFEDVSFSYNGKDPVLRRFFLGYSPRQDGCHRRGLPARENPAWPACFCGFTTFSRDVLLWTEGTSGSIRCRHCGGASALCSRTYFSFLIRFIENIAYGRPDATEQEIIEAAKLADAHEFIMKLPDGYDSAIGERGVKLSGGAKNSAWLLHAFSLKIRLSLFWTKRRRPWTTRQSGKYSRLCRICPITGRRWSLLIGWRRSATPTASSSDKGRYLRAGNPRRAHGTQGAVL